MTERQLPEDPRARALIQHALNSKVSRRTLLAAAGAGAVATGLAACAPGGDPVLTPATDVSDTEKVVRWANWPLYIDVDETGSSPTLVNFETQTGIKVTYKEEIPSNEDFYALVKDPLLLGQDINWDLVTLTDYFAARMVRRGVMQEIGLQDMPNVVANLNPQYNDITYDPGRLYSLPWQSGMTGLGWNTNDFPGGLTSIEELWDPKLKGKIVLLNQWTDTLSLVMMSQGVDISGDWGDDEFNAALDVIKKQVADGQIRAFTGNEYKENFANGDVIAGVVWSGDVFQMNVEEGIEGKYNFGVPDTGGYLWSDNFMIPMGSPHKKNAQELINYYYDPEVAAQVAAYVNFITPVVGAQEAMLNIDPALAESELIFPTDATLSNTQVFRQMSVEEEAAYAKEYEKVQAG